MGLRRPAQQAAILHGEAIKAFRNGSPEEAIQFLAAAQKADPGWAVAANDLGNVLASCGRLNEAAAAFRKAVAIEPSYAEAFNNLGNVSQMAGSLDEAVDCYSKAVELKRDYAEAHRNLGSALRRLGRLDDAVHALTTAITLNPGYAEAAAQLVYQLKEMCDWREVDQLTARLVAAVRTGRAAVNPFVFLTLETTGRDRRLCAESWAAAHKLQTPRRPFERRDVERLTIGYLSADFQEHATAQLMVELFELHDRSRFRIQAYSYGADDGSAMRRRLRDAFDDFVDIENLSHPEAAARIHANGVDILVDLKGYTMGARPQITALRPAPVQVSYLGFPGTMGMQAVDYVIADRFVVPEDRREHFTEKVFYLSECYWVSGRHRQIAERPTRADCGLPESGFVFCCFNTAYKITPPMFEIWMRLLAQVPGSVLWLLEPNARAKENLLREASARLAGGGERLVFGPTLPNARHLARLANADLFLDTLPYNAHTLTADSLWAGCPVVTCPGETFPSRVAGSLLQAIGLPELVTGSLSEYEGLAVALARDAGRLRGIREKVWANRLTTRLFDTAAIAREIEAAYERMWMERDAR